ncbi:MAG: rhomboid family intramembrane serine protease [Bacilli bacterium]|jgi:rhomboid protease GluP
MNEQMVNPRDELVMKLLHYFITEEGYNPIIIHGSKNEIWLEKFDAPYRIIRIMTGHIHNKEQLEFDLYKTHTIMSKIKRKTFTFKLNLLAIFIDLEEDVTLNKVGEIDCININNEYDLFKDEKIKRVFPKMPKKVKFVEEGLQLFAKITKDINEKSKKEALKAENLFKIKKPYLTYFLMGINILIFLLMYIYGKGSEDLYTLLKFGALQADLVKHGHYFRLLSSAFIHIGIFHLAFNMYALNILGTQLENLYGKYKFLMVYLFSALTGSLMSMAFNPTSISAGASGAIFGLLGSLLYFGYHYRVYLGNALTNSIIPIIILNLFLSFMIPGIDQFAHLGGLAGGVLMSMAVGIDSKTKKIDQINGIILSFLTLLFLIYIAFIYVH